MRKGQGSKYNAVLEVDGEPRGYAIYRIQPDGARPARVPR